MDINAFKIFKAIDFLELSIELNNKLNKLNSNKSAIERTIASRAYYSSFLYVRKWATNHLGYRSNPIKDHRQLPNFISKYGPFDKSMNKNISANLNTLKTLRQLCDYEIGLPEYNEELLQKNTKEIINISENIIKSFKNLNKKN